MIKTFLLGNVMSLLVLRDLSISCKNPELLSCLNSGVSIGDSLYNQTCRIYDVVIPILQECDSISTPIYLVTDSQHLYCSFKDLINSKDWKTFSQELFTTTLAVAYLVWNILESDLWGKVGTVEDLVYNFLELIAALSREDYLDARERIFDIINDAVWLYSYYTIYIEIEALSYAIDMLTTFYYGLKELKEDRKLEFVGKMVITAFRMNNVFSYFPEIRKKWEKN
jgi:hypothetical protein